MHTSQGGVPHVEVLYIHFSAGGFSVPREEDAPRGIFRTVHSPSWGRLEVPPRWGPSQVNPRWYVCIIGLNASATARPHLGGEMKMMKCQFHWWRKPEYPQETRPTASN